MYFETLLQSGKAVSASEQVRKKEATGNSLLIILVTSGLGGLLNAIANMRELDWSLLELGVKADLVISLALIVLGIVLRQFSFWKAGKLWPK